MLWLRKTITKMATADIEFIKDNLILVRDRVGSASARRPQVLKDIFPNPRLVAVSKIKPKECIIEAYNHGQRHFGENYVQELVDKASDEEILKSCPDIQWHLIGHLQRNKISKLVSVINNIFVVETVDSESLAKALNDALQKRGIERPLNVMIQVNTSGEDAKSGTEPEKCPEIVKYVLNDCPNLKLIGLMTIGEFGVTPAEAVKDFQTLFNVRENVCTELNLDKKDVELSMGMSSDFEEAIITGSTNIRVGTTIFGARQQKLNH